ncbi:hypothetical protein JB92DRAFT_2009118 [Gautieria morchelliformis]|nr:hypothetical protein JB92DRAFT_2009118 [Gautieria morchelliformis]
MEPDDGASRVPPVNIESGFFYFKPPRTREDVEILRHRFHTYREASFEAPLYHGHVLAVTNYMGSYHGQPSSGTRKLPPLIRQSTGYTVIMPILVLEAPMQVGNVVIKLFQESYLKIGPSIEDIWGDLDYAEWFPGARLAANEAWAYDRMRALQGRTVPWSYRFCKCVLPNGETTFGHVMEVIDGPTASTTTADELGLDDVGVFNLADALATAVHEMHECGVAHRDIKADNVIIHHNPSNQDGNVVLLDLSLCEALGSPLMRKLADRWDMGSISLVFGALGIVSRTQAWLRTRLQMNVPYGEVLAELDRYRWLGSYSDVDDIPMEPPLGGEGHTWDLTDVS